MTYKPKVSTTAEGGTGLSAAGSNGNILTASGGVWTSAAPVSSGVTSVSGTADRITSTGGATPVIDIAATYVGQTSITTLGTVGTGTWSATTIAANKGGTGQVTNTNHGVLIGQGSSSIAATSAGTSGQHLQSQGASADPTWTTATFPATATGTGKFLTADGTNWIASTPTIPNSAGTSGKVLVSDGTNFVSSTPTFPNASATTRKIIVSDGTNWVASTETYAVPSTSGNVLTSDGTNWTSAAASGGSFLVATKNLTSLQIKALRATPIEIIPAPGSGKAIICVYASMKFTYGGNNAFTAAAAQAIGIYYNNNTTQIVAGTSFITNNTIVSTANKFAIQLMNLGSLNQAAGVLDNVNVAIYENQSATEITGNANNDNTISVQIGYYIVTF